MSLKEQDSAAAVATFPADPTKTPAGIQRTAILTRRRWIVFVLNAVTYLALLYWLASVLGRQGWSVFDILIFLCFAIAAPWTVLGLWNALIGVWALHFSGDPIAAVAPHAAAAGSGAAITARTAIVMTIYNEDPARAILRLEIVRESVERTGYGDAFDYFVLSDTRDPAIARREEEEFAAWQARAGSGAAHLSYRRRATNEGFKAGNMREFVEIRGSAYEFMIPLDADSLMSGEAILRLVRVGQAWPKIGILQGLVVGAPAKSGFARMFQFGMRHAMRPYTSGAAWWNGDCGPFWGHNALVRIAPFRDHCHLPELPGRGALSGRILSHDQVEAVLMRRAGYEVRVLPQEGGNWEDNPPTLAEFSRRDTRWCQGNLQYIKLLDMTGIEATSRFQLIWAIMMFIGIPAWTAIIALIALKPLDGEDYANFPAASALWLYVVFMLMYLSPKLAGYVDVVLTTGGLKSYGGGLRFALGVVIETIFSLLLSPATTFRTAVFVLGLPFGLSATWSGQSRDAHHVAFDEAAKLLWPQLLFGLFIYGAAFLIARALIVPSMPLTLGYLIAIPFAVFTSSALLGEVLQRTGLCAIPEEYDCPREIADFESGGAADMGMLDEWRGLWRSLKVYRLDANHARALDAMHRAFVKPGDLVFDIGAHVGDRTASFRRLGASVIACEPQKNCARLLRLLHGRDRNVTVVETAVSDRAGMLTFSVNTRNPTVSTLSRDFVAAANAGAKGWERQVWDRQVEVPATTLDALIEKYGRPSFVKIDVEGAEEQVLRGLSASVPALSFEFTTIQRDVALACLTRCEELGFAMFNMSLGESQAMTFESPVDAQAMRGHIAALPHEANSGDIYAMLAGRSGQMDEART